MTGLPFAGNFTDVGRFTLRCVSCQKGLVGQQDAVEHAKASQHAGGERSKNAARTKGIASNEQKRY